MTKQTATTQPPISPSHVLFGLAADSGLDPALRPTNRPPMS